METSGVYELGRYEIAQPVMNSNCANTLTHIGIKIIALEDNAPLTEHGMNGITLTSAEPEILLT